MFKYLPKKFLAKQFRKPSGLVGHFFLAKFFNKGNRGIESFMHETCQPQRGEKLLEIGPGNGRLLNEMLHDVGTEGEIHAIDISDVMIRQFRKLNKSALKKNNTFIHKAGIQQIPYPDEIFDKVYTNNTIYFWPDQEKCIKEVYRILKPGGSFYCGFRTAEQVKDIPLIANTGVFNMRSVAGVIELFEQAGFQHVVVDSREDKPFDSYIASGRK